MNLNAFINAVKANEIFKLFISDGEKAIELAPTWAKGYSRKGAALYALARFEEAKIAYEEASKLEPTNQTFKGIRSCDIIF